MLDTSNELTWKRFLSEHPKLKELAIAAGVENDPKRAQELNCAYAVQEENSVVKNEAEREFARYLFCRKFENESAD